MRTLHCSVTTACGGLPPIIVAPPCPRTPTNAAACTSSASPPLTDIHADAPLALQSDSSSKPFSVPSPGALKGQSLRNYYAASVGIAARAVRRAARAVAALANILVPSVPGTVLRDVRRETNLVSQSSDSVKC